VLSATDGMRVGAQTRPPTSTTFMCDPNVPMEGMLQAAVALPVRSKAPSCNVHWEHRPWFICDYVWSDVEMLDVMTALVMEMTPPVSEPPQNGLVNIERWNMISSRPHLFCVTMPINIHGFCEMLASHPNQPLVKSVCKGLCEGFWPWAVTDGLDALSIVDNAVLQKLRDPSHLCFMEEQRDEEIRLGHFSEAFMMLSNGMTTILLWVVLKPHLDKSHLVVDHSAGDYSPNSFISSNNAGVHLDMLHVLGKALTHVRNQYGVFLLFSSRPTYHKHTIDYQCIRCGSCTRLSLSIVLIMLITTTILATEELASFGSHSLALFFGLRCLLSSFVFSSHM